MRKEEFLFVKIEEKKKIVKEIRDKSLRSEIVIVTDYKGLDVSTITDLRRKLTEHGIEYRVVKNSLLIRAFEGTDMSVLKDHLKGPSAVAFGYDEPVTSAKVLAKFSESHDHLTIKIGMMNGKPLALNEIKVLASLPSREVLLGQMLSTINSVPTGLVRVLNEIPRGFLNVLNAVKEKKEAALILSTQVSE
jgi:large subunit ribosomal protein L10